MLCHEKTDFTEIKQILDALFQTLGTQYQIQETEHPSFIEGRVGRISVKLLNDSEKGLGKSKTSQRDKKLAYIGEIDPEVLSNWGLTMPVTALEINLTELFKLIK